MSTIKNYLGVLLSAALLLSPWVVAAQGFGWSDPGQPYCSQYVSPVSIIRGEPSTIYWYGSNMLWYTIDNGIGMVFDSGWYGYAVTEGSGAVTVYPQYTTTYTGYASNFSMFSPTMTWEVQCPTTVYVSDPPAPSCTINVSPSSVNYGGSATVSWSGSNATWLYINGIGYVNPAGGSTTVAPGTTTTYSGSAGGAGGTASCSGSRTLSVNQSCSLPWGGTIANGQSVTAYQASSVAYGNSCVSQTRTCTNGTLSGTYTNQSCSVGAAANCTVNGTTVTHGSSQTFYSAQAAPTGQVCSSVSQSRTCTNGTMSGSSVYQYASCTCSVVYSCSGTQQIMRQASNCASTIYATCIAPQFCSAGQSTCISPTPVFTQFGSHSGHLQASPVLVQKGGRARLYWNVGNVSSCTVTGTNGDVWSGTASGASGQQSAVLQEQTKYTLRCVKLDGTQFTENATVNVIPTFQEL